MSYENARSTRFLATRCVCCGNPLTDAKSVEFGIGPICRKKHGFDGATGEPDFEVARFELAQAYDASDAATRENGKLETVATRIASGDARGACNAAVYHIAAQPQSREASRLVAVVAALGFDRLARVIASRQLGAITVEKSEAEFVVRSPFSTRFNEELRSVPGAYWHKKTKTRRVPLRQRAGLWRALRKGYAPGTVVVGDRVARV